MTYSFTQGSFLLIDGLGVEDKIFICFFSPVQLSQPHTQYLQYFVAITTYISIWWRFSSMWLNDRGYAMTDTQINWKMYCIGTAV